MTVYVALLRGINVGGATTLPMARLREVATECGLGPVGTYIQSGNLVCHSSESGEAVALRLATALANAGGPAPRVAVRSREELDEVLSSNPYLARSGESGIADPALHVGFLVSGGVPPHLAEFAPDRFAPEELTVLGREVYLYLPGGMGRSKLAEALVRHRPAALTMRNWRTVTKLAAMAREP